MPKDDNVFANNIWTGDSDCNFTCLVDIVGKSIRKKANLLEGNVIHVVGTSSTDGNKADNSLLSSRRAKILGDAIRHARAREASLPMDDIKLHAFGEVRLDGSIDVENAVLSSREYSRRAFAFVCN